MTIKNFLKQFKTSTNRKKTCEARIKETYVPYAMKLVTCKNIIFSSSYRIIKDSEGNKTGEEFMVNTPAKIMLFSMELIRLYTDVEVDLANITECFDELEREDAVVELLGAIPEREFNRFKSLLEMVYDDVYENSRSLAGYFDHNSRALFSLLEGLVPKE